MVMMAIYGVFLLFCYLFDRDPRLNRWEALILLCLCAAYVRHLFGSQEVAEQVEAETTGFVNSMWRAGFALAIGGCFTVFGARLMVDNVVWAARDRFHVPEDLVSATVIAIGTSIPELAVTLAGIFKKRNDIALGNVIGSNIFNLALIMGVTGMVRPVGVSLEVRYLLLPFMFVTGLVLTLFMRTRWTLSRGEGIAFLIGYLSFLGSSIYQCLN